MDLEQLRAKASELFPLAVRFAIANPDKTNPPYEELHRLCRESHSSLRFTCVNDCFDEIIPKVAGKLSLDAWCEADLVIGGWEVNVVMRPYYLGARYAHFEIRHRGPIAGLTETGYRSHFTPLATFAEFTPEEYLSLVIGIRPREQQMDLF